MDDITIKYISVISTVIFGFFIFSGLLYKLFSSLGNTKKSYKKSLSFDKLYDEAGGNDPLSDSRMTTQIDISSDDYSCGFLMTHKGVRDRQIECRSGCTDDKEDKNSNFCKQFIYKDPNYSIEEGDNNTESLSDNLLDKSYVGRRKTSKSEDSK